MFHQQFHLPPWRPFDSMHKLSTPFELVYKKNLGCHHSFKVLNNNNNIMNIIIIIIIQHLNDGSTLQLYIYKPKLEVV